MTELTRSASRSLTRRSALATLTAALAAPSLAPGAAATGSLPPENRTPTGAIRSYADMQRELERIARASGGAVRVTTLSEQGTAEQFSEQGRELYVATVGHGPEPVWIQGRVHGDEPYGLDACVTVLDRLAAGGSADVARVRDEFTVHVIPMYNPDGSEMNTRTTTLWDRAQDAPVRDAEGAPVTVDLNRDWRLDGFRARESRAWYEYWTRVRPSFVLDLHHQSVKQSAQTGEDISFSLGVSLAPGGPTLPEIRGGEYDVLTRQMIGHVWQSVRHRGHISADRYDVGDGQVIDIRGGVVSAMMLGLNWNGLNADSHANPAVFFETSGNTREGGLGQKARGKLLKQNAVATMALLTGWADSTVTEVDPAVWDEIPHAPVEAYVTDWGGVIPA